MVHLPGQLPGLCEKLVGGLSGYHQIILGVHGTRRRTRCQPSSRFAAYSSTSYRVSGALTLTPRLLLSSPSPPGVFLVEPS